ncbi:MAG: DUF6930 domain-containing protein [Dehalococcoidia bacterium]
MKQPSHSDWSALYQVAITFKSSAPWKWVDNEYLFAVENPVDGEVGYCSILGSGGQEFGLGMLVGEQGYHRFTDILKAEDETQDFEAGVKAPSISLLFVDRDVLQKEDREVIRSLGLRFRGRNAWPFFRSQKPGYIPWFLEKEEATLLTTAIHQALAVASSVQNGNLDPWARERDSAILTRCYRDDRWTEEWRKPPTGRTHGQETDKEDIGPVQEAELQLVSSWAEAYSGVWELDIFALPMPVAPTASEADRPYYPLCFLAVERKLGLVVAVNITNPWLTTSEKRNQLIQIFKKANQLPSEVRIKSDKLRGTVEPITDALGIKIRVASLPMLQQAKAHLYERFT